MDEHLAKRRKDENMMMYQAVINHDVKEVVELMQRGVVLNFALGDSGINPLVAAILYSTLDMVRFLIQNGACPYLRTANGMTAVHYLTDAYAEGYDGILKEMLVLYPEMDRNLPDFNGMTPLHHSAYKGQSDFVKILCEHGASTSVKTYSGETPLGLASHRCEPQVVSVLLEFGANPNQFGRGGPPLFHAITSSLTIGLEKALETCELLVGAGADVDFKSGKNGPSLLQTAVALGQEELVYLLLENGADVSYINSRGYNAIEIGRIVASDERSRVVERMQEIKTIVDAVHEAYRQKEFETMIDLIVSNGRMPIPFKQLYDLPMEAFPPLQRLVESKVAMEVATFSALFAETVDDETSYQTEVEGPVAEELAAVNVSPCAKTRRAYRALASFLKLND